MYKVVVTRKSKNQPIAEKYICKDFEATGDRLLLGNVVPNGKDNIMVFMLHSIESFYSECYEGEES